MGTEVLNKQTLLASLMRLDQLYPIRPPRSNEDIQFLAAEWWDIFGGRNKDRFFESVKAYKESGKWFPTPGEINVIYKSLCNRVPTFIALPEPKLDPDTETRDKLLAAYRAKSIHSEKNKVPTSKIESGICNGCPELDKDFLGINVYNAKCGGRVIRENVPLGCTVEAPTWCQGRKG